MVEKFSFYRSKIRRFVFLDHDSRPVISIELNDNSHVEDKRKARDASLFDAFTDASIP